VMGVVPREQLIRSVAPFSDAAEIMWGPIGAFAIALAVIVSSIGALNGWTLLMGQVPMAAAQDRLFPQVFSRLSARGVPAIGIVISATLSTALVLVQAAGSEGMRAVYATLVGLSTMTAVVPYAFCALAAGLIGAHARAKGKGRGMGVVEVIGFIFALFTLYGCGPEPVLYGLMLLMLGIPVYVWQRRRAAPAADQQ
jgi:APA family basic amino acid/polyamine antiporter